MNQPAYIPKAWASDGSYADIPESTAAKGRASWSAGFPPETAQPVASGGVPPNWLDFQGVLNMLSQHAVFAQRGSRYQWSADIDYPQGACVEGSDGLVWQAFQPSGPNTAAGSRNPAQNASPSYWGAVASPDGTSIAVDSGGRMKAADLSSATALPSEAADARTIAALFGDRLSVKDFGAKGDGVSDDTEALQAAVAHGGYIYFPAGTYILKHMVRIPSNTALVGAGQGVTVIKASSTAARYLTMFQTGAHNDPRENVRIQDLTVDGNILARLGNAAGEPNKDYVPNTVTYVETMRGSNITVCNTKNVHIVRATSKDPGRHCLDITGGLDFGSGDGYPQNGDSCSVDSEPSRDVHVVDCHFEGGADDNFTCHQSSDILISGCTSRNSRGIVVNNSCGFEIDDGSRNVVMVNCIASGCYRGILIKAHKGQACPYNVAVSNSEVWNCVIGVLVWHTDIETVGSSASQIFSAGGKTVTDSTGTAVTPYGLSPTGRNIRLTNVSVYAPRSYTDHSGTVYEPQGCLFISRVSDVLVDTFTCDEGYYATGIGYDYQPAERLTRMPVFIGVSAEDVTVNNLNVIGFAVPPSAVYDSGTGKYLQPDSCNVLALHPSGSELSADAYYDSAVYVGATRYVTLKNIVIRDSRPYGVWTNRADYAVLDSISIDSTDTTDKRIGVYCITSQMLASVGAMNVTGYTMPYLASSGTYNTSTGVLALTSNVGFKLPGHRFHVGTDAVVGDSEYKIVRLFNDKGGKLDYFSFQLSSGNNGSVLYAKDGTTKAQLVFNSDQKILCSAVNLEPYATGVSSLGSSDKPWEVVYAVTDTIQPSDVRLKASIEPPSEALMRAWGKVRFAVFQLRDSIAKKGADAARIHVGVLAQEVAEAFASEGLDASRYGLFCYDEWEDAYEDVKIVDVEGSYNRETDETVPEVSHVEHRQIRKAGDRYGIRYAEALALECAYQRWRLEQIEARLAAMEGK